MQAYYNKYNIAYNLFSKYLKLYDEYYSGFRY